MFMSMMPLAQLIELIASSMMGDGFDVRASEFCWKKNFNIFLKPLRIQTDHSLLFLGGAKVADKIELIESLLDKVDEMIIGGGMAYIFLKVINNMEIRNSLFYAEVAYIVEEIVAKAKENKVVIHLPVEFAKADQFAEDANTGSFDIADIIPSGWMGSWRLG